jgi:hypothetical protein
MKPVQMMILVRGKGVKCCWYLNYFHRSMNKGFRELRIYTEFQLDSITNRIHRVLFINVNRYEKSLDVDLSNDNFSISSGCRDVMASSASCVDKVTSFRPLACGLALQVTTDYNGS